MLQALVLYNRPELPESHPDWASESGVLETVDAVCAALVGRGHAVRRLAIGSSASELVQLADRAAAADVVVNLCEGLGGTGAGEAAIAGLIEELFRLPLTGAPPECLALVRDKARTKWLLQGAGLPTAPFFYLSPADPVPQELRDCLADGPWLVKPGREDASLGISQQSVVEDFAALEQQVASIRSRFGEVLVERYVPGREFNVGIVALPEPVVLPIAEIQFGSRQANPWQLVTYDAKWTPGTADYESTPVACPALLDNSLAERLRAAALAAFKLTNCRDYARVDFRVDTGGAVYILEVNANPDLSPSAGFARGLSVAGVSYDGFIERLVQAAAARRIRPQICSDDRRAGFRDSVVVGP